MAETDFSPEAIAARAAHAREVEAEWQRKLEATKGRRSLRRESLPASSKLRARYGVYVDGKRVGAVGLTRKGYWWPIIDGRLNSSITFGGRDNQAEFVIEVALRDGKIS